MLRYLNMFVLIGIVLVIISAAGFATGGNFLHEPGQKVDATASWVYLGAGVLMLFNGFLSIRTASTPSATPSKPAAGEDGEEEDGEPITST
ncbi:MAG TPA: hypothetical protein VKU00_32925 [Chthonomonadaceae bacterium]|nr:hypothetical protein [Chthonomonadaceae bacterium]